MIKLIQTQPWRWFKKVLDFLEHASFITTTVSIVLLISFLTTQKETYIFEILDIIFVAIIILKAIYAFFYAMSESTNLKALREFFTASFLLIIYGWAYYFVSLDAPKEIKPIYQQFALILKGLLYCFYILINWQKIRTYIKKMKLDAVKSFSLGYIFFILLGSWLLSLPFSTLQPVSYLDNLFTATSAICITGLVTIDFGTSYTIFGQIVVLVLIQIGGIGIMTFTSFILLYSGEQMNFNERKQTLEIFHQKNLNTLKGLLITMLTATIVIELIGAASIYCSMDKLAWQERILFSLFHAVSAFCHAGFSPLPDNLISFYNHSQINITISTLIILGGLGFPVLLNLKEKIFNHKALLVHTKIVLMMTAILVVLGAVIFFAEEQDASLKNFKTGDKILVSVFQSVTTRSAGFNTVDTSELKPTTYIWMTGLMFIGASPLSTGGGFKVTSLFVMIALLVSLYCRSSGTFVFGQKIKAELLIKIGALFFLRIGIIILGTLLILHFNPKIPIEKIVFEVTSGFSTVGLSAGVTSRLADESKIVIMLMMYAGRIGILNIFAVLFFREKKLNLQQVHYRQGYVIVE